MIKIHLKALTESILWILENWLMNAFKDIITDLNFIIL